MTENADSRTAKGSCASPSYYLRPVQLEPQMLAWLWSAAKLPGRTLHVAMTLAVTEALTNRGQHELANLERAEIGLDRCSKYRALTHLERSGLVSVTRRIGRSPLVSICSPAALR